jgi:hypothetical protein
VAAQRELVQPDVAPAAAADRAVADLHAAGVGDAVERVGEVVLGEGPDLVGAVRGVVVPCLDGAE